MQRKNKIFNGAILTVAMRWSDRLIGFVSMIILARLLIPADFGIVSMASLVVGFIDVLLDLGVAQVLIHKKNPDKDDYNTAWTLRLLQASLASLIVFMTAPFVSVYFNNPAIEKVLQVMSAIIIIGGLENIGIITFQKEMQFSRDFKFFFCKRLIGFLVTLSVAYLLKSYWAMVLGSMAGRISGVILSYSMHTFRPRICLSRIKEIWSFSQWILFKNIGIYFDTRMDSLCVGRSLDATMLGGYTVADEISSLPTTELLSPLGRVLFPAFVEKRDDPKAFSERVALALGVQSLVAIPASLGLMFVAYDIVFLLLGEKWLFVVPVIKVMSLSHLVGTLAHSSGYALLALGKVKIQALIIWFQAILYVGIVFYFDAYADAQYFAIIRFIVITAGSVLLICAVLFYIRILSITDFLSSLIRPVFSGIVMIITLDTLVPLFNNFLMSFNIFNKIIPVALLVCEITTGAFVYIAVILILWFLIKRPDGAEAYLLKNILVRKNNFQ